MVGPRLFWLVLGLVAVPSVAVALPQPDHGDRHEAILIHGFSMGYGNDPGRSAHDEMDDAKTYLDELGYRPQTWGFYLCDSSFDVHISAYGSHTGWGSDTGHEGKTSNCDSDNVQANAQHTRDARIGHLAYHFAWALYEREYLKDDCPVVFAYSMGGLIVRYALMAAGEIQGFPPALCISTVVTLGTPHGGSNMAGYCSGDFIQCAEMRSDSKLIGLLEEFAQHPEGVGGTRWVNIASEEDGVAPPATATDMAADVKVIYDADEGIDHYKGAWGTDYWMFARGDATAHLRWWDERGGPFETEVGNFPFRLGDLAHFDSGWDCGVLASPWTLTAGQTTSGDAEERGCKYRLRTVEKSIVIDLSQEREKVELDLPGAANVQCVVPAGQPQRCFIEGWQRQTLDFAVKRIKETTTGRFSVNAWSYVNQAPSVSQPLACAGLDSYGFSQFVGDPGATFSCQVAVTDESKDAWAQLGLAGSSFSRVSNQTAVWPQRPAVSINGTLPAKGNLTLTVVAGDGMLTKQLISKTVLLAGPPAAPLFVQQLAGGKGLSWSAPFDTGKRPITEYRIYDADSDLLLGNVTTTSWTFPASFDRTRARHLEVVAANRIGQGQAASINLPAASSQAPKMTTVPASQSGTSTGFSFPFQQGDSANNAATITSTKTDPTQDAPSVPLGMFAIGAAAAALVVRRTRH